MKTDVGELSNHPGVGCAPSRPALPVASRRRGITSAIAMTFMVLIGCLALGFYATMTTSTKLSENDQKGARALMAAESGIQFMRLNRAHVQLPPLTTPDQVLAALFADLKVSTRVIGNLGANTVGFANGTISIPAEANQILVTNAADNTGFRVTITRISPTTDGVVCTVTGHTGTGRYHRSKRVALEFTRQEIPTAQRPYFAERLLGIYFPAQLEPFVYRTASDLSSDYSGGYWTFLELGNGGFYMCPETGQRYRVASPNGFECVLSADAFGITACLYAYSRLSFVALKPTATTYARQYHALREYMMDHAEAAEILRATD